MSRQHSLPTDRKAEANRTKAPAHTLSGRDSVGQPNETESSLRLTDTLGVTKTFEVATPSPNYSKRPSTGFKITGSPPNS